MMFRYFIELSYRGTNYSGWQRQRQGISVQGVVEKSLSIILRSDIKITGCGRTDAGVHAKQYFAHFDFDEIGNINELVFKLNSILPEDISINNILKVNNDIHARYDAISRTYEYYISNKKNPFRNEFVWQLAYNLDIEKMNEAAGILKSYSDFTCFAKLHSSNKTNICKIFEAKWYYEDNLIVFRIKANRFLRNMVRAIVGAHVDIGRGKLNINDYRQMIETKNRKLASSSAPAKGLFLSNVEYPLLLK